MSGEIDLLLWAIAAYETDALPDLDAFPFRFVESIRLERWEPGAGEPGASVDGFAAWFETLRAIGVQRLQLAFPGVNAPGTLPQRHTFGFSNSTGAFLVAAGPRPERWRALWAVGDRDAPDRRIWRITFQGLAHDPRAVLLPTPPLDEIAASLAAAIDGARAVAARGGLADWEQFFTSALAIAVADPGSALPAAAHVSPLPEGWLSPVARRLLDTARAANGFGAMGSWNDVGLADAAAQAAYEQTAQQLFQVMLHALVAGANTR